MQAAKPDKKHWWIVYGLFTNNDSKKHPSPV